MTPFRICALAVAALMSVVSLGCSLLAPTDAELTGGRQSGGTKGAGGASTSGGSAGVSSGGGAGGGGSSAGGTGGHLGTGGTGGSPGPAPTQPAMTSLSLWLRADSGLSTTDNQVTAWVSPALDGFPSYTVGQAVDAQQPVLGTVPLGGRALPMFDGNDDFLANPEDHDFTSQNGYAFFVVLRPAASEGAGEILSIDGANAFRLGLWQRDSALEFASTDPTSPKLLTQGAFLTEDPVMIEVIGTRSPRGEAIVSTFINGLPIAGGAAPTWEQDVETGFTLGGRDVEAPRFSGSIAEVLIYNERLDGAARFGTEAYLRAKWGCCGG